jgi:hypothetical protein
VPEKERSKTMEKEIARIGKNALEEIRVKLTEYNGYDLVDMRVWAKHPIYEKETPTRKGLTVNPELIPEIVEALEKAKRAFREGQGEKE